MESVKSSFLFRKKSKPFVKFLKKWLGGKHYSDIQVGKNLSSMLTHSLIDLQGIGTPMFRALDIPFQADCINRFLSGGLSNEEIRELYKERFGDFI